MYNQHKVFRVFELIRHLRMSPYFTPTELAEEMNISTRSVYRYLNLVENLGYPLQKNERGAYMMHSAFVELPLSKEELELIVNCVQKMNGTNPAAQSLLQRINSIPPTPVE